MLVSLFDLTLLRLVGSRSRGSSSLRGGGRTGVGGGVLGVLHADGCAGNNQLHAPVLLAALGGCVLRHRPGLAKACGGHVVLSNTSRGQKAGDGARSVLADLLARV